MRASATCLSCGNGAHAALHNFGFAPADRHVSLTNLARPAGPDAVLLRREAMTPVCTPALLEGKRGGLRHPDDRDCEVLLHHPCADLHVIRHELASGALVAPFDLVVSEATGHFVFAERGRFEEPYVAAFGTGSWPKRPLTGIRAGPGSPCRTWTAAVLRSRNEKGGGRTRTRTLDPLIKSQLLYQLSYAPPRGCRRCRQDGGERQASGGLLGTPCHTPSMPLFLASGGCSSVVERQLPKLYVVGSIPITRSSLSRRRRGLRERR